MCVSLGADTCIRGVLYTLQERLMPLIEDPYGREVARLSGLVLAISANSLDDAVALRVDENRTMRDIFRDALDVVADGALRERLRAGAGSSDPGLRLSQLDGENARLRGMLIDLHAHAENLDAEGGRALCRRIWRSLSDFEMARAPRR